ncbi:hypothetical protein [Aurantiacibacter poecillastricola]|uniref:hypothetical protein n=1 Tax=Aurantiacibacter poecillastricola TaxID=3064385 RepID=UPI00273E86AB|nr:hypothetical protein [Aurantiacibacter sp. 219JJ12-13]MDP5260385.1 hypothetical protein [Aurantiacibacter sp. 219JJ12-13]
MEQFFASGRAVDVVLAVLAAEFVILVWKRWSVTGALLVLLPAALILLGLRAALTEAAWYWIALPLTLAFPVHLADLARRTRR